MLFPPFALPLRLVCAHARELNIKEMRHQPTAIALLLSAGLMLGSCLGHDHNDTDYTFYNDAAVTAFSLGTLKRPAHTTASTGEDSTYIETFTSTVSFYIDQDQALIYNPDSLPYSTDVSSVLATISAKNSGVVMFQDLEPRESDGETTYTYYSATDSIDFSQPRILRVWALNGESWRDYKVTVNVHQQPADTISWQKMGTVNGVTAMQHLKIAAVDNSLYVFGSDGNTTQMWKSGSDNMSWAVSNALLDADAWQNVVVRGSDMFVLSEGKVIKLTGTSWTTVTPDKTLRNIIAASPAELYAIGADGKMLASTDDGASWTEEVMDDSNAPLPDDDFSFTTRSLKTNSELLRVTLFGTAASSQYAIAWTKIIDTTGGLNDGWSFVDAAGDTRYVAPKMEGLTVVDYDNVDYAFGLNDDGTLNTPLRSLDGGITWKANDELTLPTVATGAPYAITRDSNNYLWIVDRSGQVWRGRINRLGW